MSGINTLLIHSGENEAFRNGAVNLPIYQSVNFQTHVPQAHKPFTYLRLSNTPNHEVLHAKLAALEGTQAALVTASGMAAISTALLGVLKQGDHILAHNCLYGGTHAFITHDLPDWGINYDFVDARQPQDWSKALKSNTRLFYVESLTNPLLGVLELEEVCRFCQANGLLAVIDSTLTSPVNFRPKELGFDLILHSATKYLNGHSDIAAGAILGEAEHIHTIHKRLNLLGACLDPNSCFLLHRGLKTLALRVERQNQTALRLATWLENRAEVKQVYYAGLPQHPGHQLAKKWFSGFGGVLSFELKASLTATQGFLNRLRLPMQAPSLGGVESLVTRPAITSHAGLTAAERAKAGIQDGLIRFSAGLEDFEDLCCDFEQALSSQLLA